MARKQARPEPVESRTLEPIFRWCWECGRPRWVAYHNRRTVATLEGLAWIIHELVRDPVGRHPLVNGRRAGWRQAVIARPW